MKTSIAKGLDGERFLMFWCPGCDDPHVPIVQRERPERPLWTWNGDRDRPTLTPSILCQSDYGTAAEHGSHPLGGHHVCHSFVTDGRIQFLSDCTHALAGQTVDIPDWPYDDEVVQ